MSGVDQLTRAQGTSGEPASHQEASSQRRLADFVFAAGGGVITGERAQSLSLPPVAEVGAAALADLATAPLTGTQIVCGLVPFDPCDRPELFVVQRPERRTLDLDLSGVGVATTAAPATPTARDEHYHRAVADAVRDIEAGILRKVVLARRLEVAVDDLDADLVWARLAARNPQGYTFAVRRAGDVFLGASPELVAEVDDRGFATHPLAGSTPRGATTAADAARGSALLASDKDRREHGFVVDHIVGRLAPLLHRLDVPSGPGLFATDAMLHLGTRITGTLRPGVGALEAALTIHPTPAVCGVPSRAALEAIRRLEPGGRGCYAGLVGWSDARGHGQWALALRCASLRRGSAALFAGAGVVDGSTPEAEHAETAAKFGTVRAALAPRAPRVEAVPATVGGER